MQSCQVGSEEEIHCTCTLFRDGSLLINRLVFCIQLEFRTLVLVELKNWIKGSFVFLFKYIFICTFTKISGVHVEWRGLQNLLKEK